MNNLKLSAILCFLGSYLLGGVNPSYIISKIKGFDIRKKGSGNAGASNAVITLGKKIGVLCCIFDIFKAYIAVKITAKLYPLKKIYSIIAGVLCILGHMFPLFMGFKGGKGLACIGGVILAYDLKTFAILLALEIAIALISQYIVSMATSVSIIFTGVLLFKEGLLYALVFVPIIITVWMKHMINFRRIKYGVEAKVSYLWKKDEEKNRIEANWYKLTQEERIYVNILEPTI